MIDLTIKIGGEAGFGIMTTGVLVGKIATRSGYQTFEYSEYPSLIRGGHNVVEIRISDEQVFSQERCVDILVCLNKQTYDLHKNEVKESGVVVIDEEKADIQNEKITDKHITYVHLPISSLLQKNGFPSVMMNNIALGAIAHIVGFDYSFVEVLIRENFAKKGEEVINQNIHAANLGFEYAKKEFPDGYHSKLSKRTPLQKRMYISGNDMIGLGAIAGGCKFYCAYPMTPTSNLLHYLAAHSEKYHMVVKHAEDEISVINMALGASWGGVRSMVGTSGGGFALMVEGVSLSGITETPIVIVMGQRPGPATGMPTWTEQGDLLFIVHSGHGEFPKIVLAPGDMKEAYALTLEALALADTYQTPVFILADKYLLEGRQSVDVAEIENIPISYDRGKLLSQDELLKLPSYKRYLNTEDGISPRVIPGVKGGLHQSNSYEHGEDGHTTEEAQERIIQVEKRNRKRNTFLAHDFKMPEVFGPKDAPLTIVSWGSMKAPILQAMKDMKKGFNYIHFTYVWPMPENEMRKLLQGCKKTLLVENNATAQFGQLLSMVTGIQIQNTLLEYSGRPIYPEQICEKVRSLL